MAGSYNTIKDSMKEKFLQNSLIDLATNINLYQIKEWHSLYISIRKLINSLKNPDNLDTIVKDNGEVDITLFGKFCNHYTQNKPLYDGQNFEQTWGHYVKILEMYIEDCSPKMEWTVRNGKDYTKFNALLIFSNFESDYYSAFDLVLENSNEVDIPDANDQTPLLLMIQKNNLVKTRMLLLKGANINRVRHLKLNDGKEQKYLPIQEAVDTGNIEMIECLLDNGAITDTFPVTGSSLIHKAVTRGAQCKNDNNLQIVKLICSRNQSLLNLRALFGMNLLHTAVNAGRDDADLSLEPE